MAKVLVVTEGYWTVKVCELDDEYRADLLYYQVDRESDAVGDEKWFFTNYENDATVKVIWVSSEYSADLKVFRVSCETDARWKTNHPLISKLG